MSAFGFSVGDILTGIDIAFKIIKDLHSSNSLETNSSMRLPSSLLQVEERYLTASEEAKVHVDAAVLSCRKRIGHFVGKLEGYRSLARLPGSVGDSKVWAVRSQAIRGFVRVRWVFAMEDDLAALRTSISSDLLVLGLFVQMTEMEQALVVAQRQVILLERTERMEQNITRLVAVMDIEEDAMIDADDKATKCEEQSTWTGSNASTAVLSATQSDRPCSVAPSHIFIALCCYVWQLAKPLWRSTEALPKGPSWSLDSNIHLQDALGRKTSLPYEYFKDWPLLFATLQVDFQGLPGQFTVERRNFSFQLAYGGQFEIDARSWRRYALPGSKHIMVMEVKGAKNERNTCPTCNQPNDFLGHFEWSTWQLMFYFAKVNLCN